MAPRQMRRGFFITFEGPEGCGKSTQSRRLSRFLRSKGFPVVVSREPGGTRIGEAVRRLLLNSRNHFSPLVEVFLYELSRFELVRQVIRPALKEGKVAISDRFSDSTIVYQGMAGGVPVGFIRRLDRKICSGVAPDLTFLLDVPVTQGLRRSFKKKGSLDRMEKKSLAFHRRVRNGYLTLCRKNAKRFRLIRNGSKQKIKKQIQNEVLRVLRRHPGTRKTGRAS